MTLTMQPPEKNGLAEVPGLYGPVTVAERVLQRIWLRGDFRRENLRTLSDQPLAVLSPGRWNLLDGPDFFGAELDIGGRRVVGDVEVHFRRADWHAHGHEHDPRYGGVVLHLVLFPPKVGEAVARTFDGRQPELLVLLPHLNRDLEEYAAEEALLALEGKDCVGLLEGFLQKPLELRRATLRQKAATRWRQKRTYAHSRLQAAGSWAAACHQACLEGLGLSRNRAPMANLALAWPIERLRTEMPAVERLFCEQEGRWRLCGLRPANQPRQRIAQYLRLVNANPEWPTALLEWGRGLPTGPQQPDGGAYRKTIGLPALRDTLASSILGDAIGGTRLDTLTTDFFLPLLAEALDKDLSGLWHHWFEGDAPGAYRSFLKHAQMLGPRHPACNGLTQAALQVFLEQGQA